MRFESRTHEMRRRRALAASAVLVIAVVFANARIAQSDIFLPLRTVATAIEIPIAFVLRQGQNVAASLAALPQMMHEIEATRADNARLTLENEALREAASTRERDDALRLLASRFPGAISAECIGYDPENTTRTLTLDKGSLAGVRIDAGVIANDGVVGRVVAVTPISSTLLLLGSYSSNVPAIVQAGRYWGIVRGSLTHLKLDDVALDAPLRIGDTVVTGRGRSFPAGLSIGKIIAVSHEDAALSQTAILTPTVEIARLERVLILPSQ